MAEKVPVRQGLFAEEIDGGVLLANKCKSCGQVFFPRAIFCLTCSHKELTELKLSHRGKLYSYTISHLPSAHFPAPYAIGFINMPEGIRIFSPLVIDDRKPFNVGMEMELIIEKLWEQGGKEISGYKFRPV